MYKPQRLYKEVLRVNVVRSRNPEINYIVVSDPFESFKLRDTLGSFLLTKGCKLLSRGGAGGTYKEIYSLKSSKDLRITLVVHKYLKNDVQRTLPVYLLNINIKYQNLKDTEPFINYVEGFFERVNQSYEIY